MFTAEFPTQLEGSITEFLNASPFDFLQLEESPVQKYFSYYILQWEKVVKRNSNSYSRDNMKPCSTDSV